MDWHFPVKVVENYDGDTFKIEIDLGFGMRYFTTVRLDGVDTPELRGGTELTKAAAKFARDEAARLIREAHTVNFKSTAWMGKYNRPIGDFEIDGESLVKYLIDHRLGVPYTGGSREQTKKQHEKNAAWLRKHGQI